MEDVLLIDGSSFLYRAFYAMPSLTNQEGLPTGAIYGVINMLKRTLADHRPKHTVVVFDPKGKTQRHDSYPEYKANRSAMPEDLVKQIQPLHKMIRAMGLPLIIEQGQEADDVIATLADWFTEEGYKVTIATGDKDLAQLIDDQIRLVDTMKDRVLDEETVVNQFGVQASQIVDYLTLIGDSSDNIPGIPKVGPKTAVKWLTQYGSLQSILDHQHEIKGRVGESLREHQEQIPWVKQLITLDRTVPLSIQPEELVVQDVDHQELRSWYRSLDFKKWNDEESSHEEATFESHCVTDQTQWQELFQRLMKCEVFAFGVETSSGDPMTAEVVGLSVALQSGEGYYIPLAHTGVDSHLSWSLLVTDLKALFSQSSIMLIAHKSKFLIKILQRHDVAVHNELFDPMLAGYLLNTSANKYELSDLTERFLHRSIPSLEQWHGKGVGRKETADFSIQEATDYASAKTEASLCLYQAQSELLAEKKLDHLMDTIDTPLVRVIQDMESNGVFVSRESLQAFSNELIEQLTTLEKQAFDLAGCKFNLQSPKQLRALFFDQMELPVHEKTPSGVPSTSESVLHELAQHHPLPQIVLEYRSLAKLNSTYAEGLQHCIHPSTNRIHGSFNQTVTVTGRLSSTEPNLQNIPVRTEEGRRIRQAFMARPGFIMASLDYSQIELRIMAHASNDPQLIRAFRAGEDIHAATASEIFSVQIQDVTNEMRRKAKSINFGLMYGMSAFGLAKQLRIPRDEAKHYIDTYFDRFSGVKLYMDAVREQAEKEGVVHTLFGRPMSIMGMQNPRMKSAALRAAINAPMQGTASDIIKQAMIDLHPDIINQRDTILLVLQVHDELVFEVKKSAIDHWIPLLKKKMESAASLNVPLVVDSGTGDNWDEAH